MLYNQLLSLVHTSSRKEERGEEKRGEGRGGEERGGEGRRGEKSRGEGKFITLY